MNCQFSQTTFFCSFTTATTVGYERGSTLVTSNLPFQDVDRSVGSERLTGAPADRLTHRRAHPGDETARATAQAEQAQTQPSTGR